jgi:hypothetical protein
MLLKQSLALLFVVVFSAYPQQSPYFARNGSHTSAQILREVKNPAVYLVIAAAPGFEDRASIAQFRIRDGAAVAVAYVTNGEDIPSDLNGEMFYQLASRRKEEAYHALACLGAHAYFLNIPVNDFSAGLNCFHPTAALTNTLSGRLDSVLAQIMPDVIVLDRDPLSENGESERTSYLKRLIMNDLREKNRASPLTVKRFFVQSAEAVNAVALPVEQRDSVWSESSLQMAQKAEGFYASLRYQIPLWNVHTPHRYAQIFPENIKPSLPLDKGLPQIGKKLKTLLPAINSIHEIAKSLNREKRLEMIRHTIALVDSFIQNEAALMDLIDLRVLASWKLQLENLRCEVLGVAIHYSVSDTIITPVQVFFLKFGSFHPALAGGITQIVFPGVIQKEWIVNEARNSFYSLKDSEQFRILSPRGISLNSTETPQGFAAMQVRTPMVFIVTHRDPDPARNFMYKEEIPLIIAPPRSAEILSPQVMMYRDTIVRVRFRSNVRDESKGVLHINDPVVSSPDKTLDMPGKNFVEIDTLPLLWKDTVLTSPRQVTIWAGKGNSAGSFTVQPSDVKAVIAKKVGICSAVENSPVLTALHRLGASVTSLDMASFSFTTLSDFSVIVVDQFSFDAFASASRQLDSVEQWLRHGGRLIILPQHGAGPKTFLLGDDISFTDFSAGDCTEKLSIDSTDSIVYAPNRIDVSRFTGTPFAVSYTQLAVKKSSDSKILITSGSRVLLCEKRLDHGRMFYCALNLFPRLLDLQHASYALLANLISTGLVH